MHAYENEETRDGLRRAMRGPSVKMDPDRRCVATLVYEKQLVILPLSRAEAAEDAALADQRQVFQSWLIDLRFLPEPILSVLDYTWLHGYHVPTLLILHTTNPTWPGRYAMAKDGLCLTAISVNLDKQTHNVIWSRERLPSDSRRIVALPKPIGGALLFGVNCLVYIDQALTYGVSVNSHSKATTDVPLRTQDDVIIALDNCCAAVLSYDRLMLSLKTGDIYVRFAPMAGGQPSVGCAPALVAAVP